MSRAVMVVSALLAALALSACTAPAPETSETGSRSTASKTFSSMRLLSPAEFAERVRQDSRVLINVHVPDEGSIPGTDLAIPFDKLREHAAELPADRSTPLAVYCRSGSMSAKAVRTLTEMGYTDVIDLRGGMTAWENSGRTLLPPSP